MDNKTDGCDINRTGLTGVQAAENRLKYGDNVLTPPARTSMWLLYIEKYDDPIIRILLVAAVVSLALAFVNGEFVETVGIFFAIFLATTIGFFFERDAARKFDVLTAIGEEQPVKVVRDGKVCEIARREVTVGDVVMVEVGDEVPADGFLFEATDLQIDESALTGEPVTDKYVKESHVSTAAVSENSSIDNVTRNAYEAAYPADMLLRSTMVMNGNGRMVVTAVGDGTEIGRVARDATELTAVKTPLNRQLDRLASMISKVGVTVAMAAFVVFLGHDVLTQPLWHTDDYVQMAGVVLRYFMMAVTLIVMAVPEGLPMAVTLALALNMRRMLKSNNLVRKLHACETMGAVTVICTDKTGTLTQNKMRVNEIEVLSVGDDSKSGYSFPSLALSFALNTTAELDDSRGIGNPTEVALLRWLTGHGADYRALRASIPIEERLPFSTERKYMATLCDVDGVRWLFVKGAPEIVMARCVMTDEERTRVTGMLAGWQNKAMRTLAFACRRCDTMEVSDMTLQCVAAISDPLREEVPDAVRSCISAGIDVKIVTGDTSATAMEIARQIGMSLTAESVITGPEFAALGDDEAWPACRQAAACQSAAAAWRGGGCHRRRYKRRSRTQPCSCRTVARFRNECGQECKRHDTHRRFFQQYCQCCRVGTLSVQQYTQVYLFPACCQCHGSATRTRRLFYRYRDAAHDNADTLGQPYYGYFCCDGSCIIAARERGDERQAARSGRLYSQPFHGPGHKCCGCSVFCNDAFVALLF